MGSFALLNTVALVPWPTRWRRPALVVGVAITEAMGMSRVYLGVHYPSDVLAARTAGLAWVVGLHRVLRARPVQRTRQWRAAA